MEPKILNKILSNIFPTPFSPFKFSQVCAVYRASNERGGMGGVDGLDPLPLSQKIFRRKAPKKTFGLGKSPKIEILCTFCALCAIFFSLKNQPKRITNCSSSVHFFGVSRGGSGPTCMHARISACVHQGTPSMPPAMEMVPNGQNHLATSGRIPTVWTKDIPQTTQTAYPRSGGQAGAGSPWAPGHRPPAAAGLAGRPWQGCSGQSNAPPTPPPQSPTGFPSSPGPPPRTSRPPAGRPVASAARTLSCPPRGGIGEHRRYCIRKPGVQPRRWVGGGASWRQCGMFLGGGREIGPMGHNFGNSVWDPWRGSGLSSSTSQKISNISKILEPKVVRKRVQKWSENCNKTLK